MWEDPLVERRAENWKKTTLHSNQLGLGGNKPHELKQHKKKWLVPLHHTKVHVEDTKMR